MTSIDYYQILGLSPGATDDEIKVAYRRLVKLYHPDTNKDQEAPTRFREIHASYAILSDPVKRSEYDKKNHKKLSDRSTTAKIPDHRFAFPHLSDTASAIIHLKPMTYSLSAQEVSILRRQGMLRGIASQAGSGACYCHRCQHCWAVPDAHRHLYTHSLPSICPRCHAIDWSDFLLLRCCHCTAIFESEGPIREQMIEKQKGRLFFPYELYPHCPSCKQSQWCAAEEERLTTQRAVANQQALREKERLTALREKIRRDALQQALREKERLTALREKVRREALQEEERLLAIQRRHQRLAEAWQEQACHQAEQREKACCQSAQQKEAERQENCNNVGPSQPSSTDFDEYTHIPQFWKRLFRRVENALIYAYFACYNYISKNRIFKHKYKK
jgi:hypothetical protein